MQISELLRENKIIGLIGNSGSGKSSFIKNFEMSKKIGIADFDKAKCNIVEDQLEYYVKKYKFKLNELEERKNEIIRMLGIDRSILNQSIYEISESEFSEVIIASILLYNPEVIIIDELIDSLDYKTKTKLLKLFIKLKKFFNKKIILVTSNIDDIYEFIDEVIVIDEGKVLLYGKISIIYDNYDLLVKRNIRVPSILTFIKKMRDNGIMVDNVNTVNELIKTVYREMR